MHDQGWRIVPHHRGLSRRYRETYPSSQSLGLVHLGHFCPICGAGWICWACLWESGRKTGRRAIRSAYYSEVPEEDGSADIIAFAVDSDQLVLWTGLAKANNIGPSNWSYVRLIPTVVSIKLCEVCKCTLVDGVEACLGGHLAHSDRDPLNISWCERRKLASEHTNSPSGPIQ